MTKVDILNEIANYYSEDTSRRGLDSSGGCYYWAKKEGKVVTCGVGYLLQEPETLYLKLEDLLGRLVRDGGILDGDIKSVIACKNVDRSLLQFKERFEFLDIEKEEDVQFLSDIQTFHDNHSNWDENGITQRGEFHLQKLIVKYADQIL